MDTVTVTDVINTITIKPYGLGGGELADDHTEGELFLLLNNGQRFRIAVTEV